MIRYPVPIPSRAWRVAILLLLSFLALGHVTSAQDNSATANVRERVQRGEALYQSGQFEAAIEILKPVAKGNYSAIYRLSQAYQRLNKTKQFIDFALPLAEQGDANAQYFLADAYERERKPNVTEILRWYRSSAQGGSDLAADALGRIYYSGQIGFDLDDDDALKSLWRNRVESERYFELCVQLSQPRPVSSCLRGLAVLEADRPQRSVEKVLSLLEDARDYQSLWLIYEFGFIAKKTEDRSAEYLDRLRQRETGPLVKYFLADVADYQRGEPRGVREMALRLLPAGDIRNMTDAKTAVALMKRAADGGDQEANWWMAHFFQNGRHVPIDDVLAYFYANRAHALGSGHAKKLLDELERRMSRQEIAEAQKMAREWAASRK